MGSYMRNINKIARCGVLYREEKLKKYGITGYRHVYLYHILNDPGISQEVLSKRVLVNKSTVARQVAAMEKAGLITRKESETDRRIMNLFPTEKAGEIMPEIIKAVTFWNQMLVSDFSEEEKEILEKILEKISEKAVSYVKGNVFEPGESI